jgi:hypothetical protein
MRMIDTYTIAGGHGSIQAIGEEFVGTTEISGSCEIYNALLNISLKIFSILLFKYIVFSSAFFTYSVP